jgi:hypothetical protein
MTNTANVPVSAIRDILLENLDVLPDNCEDIMDMDSEQVKVTLTAILYASGWKSLEDSK